MKLRNLLSLALVASFSLGFFACDSGDGDGGAKLPVNSVNKSLFIKSSGTNCPPCGGWGWTLTKDIEAAMGEDGIPMVIFSEPSYNFVADLMTSPAATEMDIAWNTRGWPSFYVNGEAIGTSIDAATTASTSHKNAAVKAAFGLDASVDGNTLKIDYRVQLLEGSASDHQVALYAVEDGIVNYQAGNSAGSNTVHDNVLRGAFTSSAFGDAMTSNDMSGSATFDMVQGENRSSMSVVAVVWKKNGSSYEFINAAQVAL